MHAGITNTEGANGVSAFPSAVPLMEEVEDEYCMSTFNNIHRANCRVLSVTDQIMQQQSTIAVHGDNMILCDETNAQGPLNTPAMNLTPVNDVPGVSL